MTTPPEQDTPIAVYLIDDDDFFRSAMRRIFRGGGFDLHAYADGPTFLAEFTPAPSCCVIVDLQMPDMDGLQVLAALRTQGHQVPVILYSGNADAQVQNQAAALGASAVIEKPFSAEQLTRAVRDAVNPPGSGAH